MAKTFVELLITNPKTSRTITVNAERIEPEGKKPGSVAMFYQIHPAPPEDEKPEDRTPEEDLMYFLLSSIIKGAQ